MPETLLARIARRQSWMEPVSEAVQKGVSALYSGLGPMGRLLKSVCNGTWILRHPLHPALTDVPVGAWTAGVVADYAAHFTSRIPEAAGDVALAVGLIVAVLTVITGYTDFTDTFGLERRFAFMHGLIMTAVVLVDAASLALRWWAGEGLHPLAVGLATAAYALVLIGAWYGGHVVFGIGYPVNRSAFLEGPDAWVAAGPAAAVPPSGMHMVEAGGMRVLLARHSGRICALSAVCSHVGGPLNEGTLENGIVTCPWHASRFRLEDGRAIGGPATFDVPRLLVREENGNLEVRLEEPLH